MAELTPMMQQYMKVKEQYRDSILFYRLGDFYEMFFEDAVKASRELELVLTGRDCGLDERAPMCGVPYHAVDGYLARLVSKGYKVAICEQMEDPATAKGLVTREVIRIVTPGTVTQANMLSEDKNNYLALIHTAENAVGLCFADVSTGQVYIAETVGPDCFEKAVDRLAVFSPAEIRVNAATQEKQALRKYLELGNRMGAEVVDDDEFDFEDAKELIESHFGNTLRSLGIETLPAAVGALGAALRYLYKTQKNDLANITEVKVYQEQKYLSLNAGTRANLELTESFRRREKKGSLLWVLDKTKTAMGKRLLRSVVEQPLRSVSEITYRQNGVEELFASPVLRADLSELLSGVQDFERIQTRIVYGTANAKELRGLYGALAVIPALKEKLSASRSNVLRRIFSELDENAELRDTIDSAIVENPPFSVREGGMIREGYNEELDTLRGIVNGGKDFLLKIEREEQERTGIKKLRIGYNKVFGYYIEVLNTYKDAVPENYIRKQTLTNCERFITPELKELEAKVLSAKDRIEKLEYDLFTQVREAAAARQESILETSRAIAFLDVLLSFANVAQENQYVRPVVDLSGAVEIKAGRHPVVEKFLDDLPFVPNDVLLDRDENRTLIITGPNMAGKSTYMRQTALIVLMAQMGSFVPAKEATIGVVDAVFTRIGASDDLAAGQSTFMTEMSEVAAILENATPESLIILDEIGRGTSTYDGMAIARAVLEYINEKSNLGAKTMFATHYHELTEMAQPGSGCRNLNCTVKKRGEDVFFLRKIAPGPADGSYGIEVAKLAGVPKKVTRRAKAILRDLETKAPPQVSDDDGSALASVGGCSEEESLLLTRRVEVSRMLEELDLNRITPMEALSLLFRLRGVLDGEERN